MKKIKKFFKEIFDVIKNIIKRGITISIILGTLYMIWWFGFKGIIGMFVGMTFMAIFIVSDNPMLMFILKLMNRDSRSMVLRRYIRNEDDGDVKKESK